MGDEVRIPAELGGARLPAPAVERTPPAAPQRGGSILTDDRAQEDRWACQTQTCEPRHAALWGGRRRRQEGSVVARAMGGPFIYRPGTTNRRCSVELDRKLQSDGRRPSADCEGSRADVRLGEEGAGRASPTCAHLPPLLFSEGASEELPAAPSSSPNSPSEVLREITWIAGQLKI